MVTLEVCANSLTSAIAAQQGGASRVELCDNLGEGGTTPSYGQIALARKYLHIQLYVIIRPRGGDFLYSDLEFEIMKEDIRQCVKLGCDGVVFGILQADGNIDKERCRELLALAKPLPATFHRAFDMTADPLRALEDCIELGFERILTSGGKTTAPEGATLIADLIKRADGRIKIMPGSGVNESNVSELIKRTEAKEFHASAKNKVQSGMAFRNPDASMGNESDEFTIELSDSRRVKELVERANKAPEYRST